MDIKTGEPTERMLDEYDFIFMNGSVLPLTLDLNLGDTIDFTPEVITVTLVAKPSVTDPKGEVGDNTTTIYRKHLLFYEHRRRNQMSISTEQRIEYEKTIKALSGKGASIH